MLKAPPSNINKHLNKHISTLCSASLGKNNGQNHCAHFVSHVMEYELPGVTCKNLSLTDKQSVAKGATIMVNELFNKCTKVDKWDAKPASTLSCLVFVTISSNVKKLGNKSQMGDHPLKHIGILHQGKIWNYSNTNNKVVADIPTQFISKFSTIYKKAGNTVDFYYGSFL